MNYSVLDGDRSGLTIFFCHGGGGNRLQWRNQWRHLSDAGHRLVAWDCLGHGGSVQPRVWRAYDSRALVDDYLQILGHFGGRRNLLIAHSFGTHLTLSALSALREQGKLDSVSGALLLGVPSPFRPIGARGLLKLPSFVLEWLRPRFGAGFRRLAWHPDADPALIAAEEAATARNTMFMFKALLSQQLPLDADALAGLRVPVRIVAGDADLLTPPEQGAQLQAALPDARLDIVEKCGHQIMLERPDAVNAIIDDVIAEFQTKHDERR